jgi:hypothetical protein
VTGQTHAYVAGLGGPDSVVSRSSEMMFAFTNPATGALVNAWKFATPDDLRYRHTMAGVGSNACFYTNLFATRIADGVVATQSLRYGTGSFSSACDSGCTTLYGAICLKSSPTPGTAGGTLDFPYYNGFAFTDAANPVDMCSTSSGSWNDTPCSATRRFAIFVR